MKAVLKLEGLCCANCAAKIENEAKKIKGVEDVTVSIVTQKMTIEAPEADIERIVEEASKVAKKIEDEVNIVRIK